MLDYQLSNSMPKPLSGSTVNPVSHSSKTDKMSTRNFNDLLVKLNQSPCSAFMVLRRVNCVPKKVLNFFAVFGASLALSST